MPWSLKPPKLKLTEADVIRQCLDYLQCRGYWVKRNPVGKYRHAVTGNFAEFGPPGIPDYLAIHAIHPAFFIEFKAPGRKLRPTQVSKFFELQVGYRLAAVMVDGLETLIDFLRGHEARHSP